MLPFHVIGHKNPDTDSISSAIGYSALLRALGEEPNAIAAGRGGIPQRTKWVLEHAGIEAPALITDVRTNAGMINPHFPALRPGLGRRSGAETPPMALSGVIPPNFPHLTRDA